MDKKDIFEKAKSGVSPEEIMGMLSNSDRAAVEKLLNDKAATQKLLQSEEAKALYRALFGGDING